MKTFKPLPYKFPFDITKRFNTERKAYFFSYKGMSYYGYYPELKVLACIDGPTRKIHSLKKAKECIYYDYESRYRHIPNK
jgi:hypothetical protein